MSVTLHCALEFPNATSVTEARDRLDAFREAVQPSMEYGLVIAEDPSIPPTVGCDCGADDPQSARYQHAHLVWCRGHA